MILSYLILAIFAIPVVCLIRPLRNLLVRLYWIARWLLSDI